MTSVLFSVSNVKHDLIHISCSLVSVLGRMFNKIQNTYLRLASKE